MSRRAADTPDQAKRGARPHQAGGTGVLHHTARGQNCALSRKKKTRWDAARQVTRRAAAKSPDFAEAAKEIMHVRNIYEEGRKVADEAVGRWSRGRKLVGY
jgi:hypothetical protein